jgi:methylmalonyl-CoA/ethylmalonyl-CoA epimerase
LEIENRLKRMNPRELSERLWDFAARVGKLVDALPGSRLGRHVAGQLLRCGTAPAPNYDEGRAAESKPDFVHKIGVVLKELVETGGWLRFVVKTGLLTQRKVASLLDEAEQLEKIIGSSRLTAQRGPRKSPINNPQSKISNHGFTGLDHLAIVVPDTEEALKTWRDRVGLKVLYSEVVNNGGVRLTHLDLGNTQLQLVEPASPGHSLKAWLAKNGPGLHHFCFKVDDVGDARVELETHGLPAAAGLHQGTQGKRALFLDKSPTQGVQVEVTGK